MRKVEPPWEMLIKDTSVVQYLPSFLVQEEAERLMSELIHSVKWEQRSVTIFGRLVPQPRLTAWIGESTYRYSGMTLHPQPWDTLLQQLRERVSAITGAHFNSALLNLYRNGKDSVAWHRDNEKELGGTPVIASLSLGAERKFVLRRFNNKQEKIEVQLGHGSLLLMKGNTQQQWEHSLPKDSSIHPRLNITFRKILDAG